MDQCAHFRLECLSLSWGRFQVLEELRVVQVLQMLRDAVGRVAPSASLDVLKLGLGGYG